MKKYAPMYILIIMVAFFSACGQEKAQEQKKEVPQQDNVSKRNYTEAQIKEAETSNVPTSMVRHVRLARNGDILVASYLGVYRYNGTAFANLTREIITPRFSSFWDVLEDQKGNLWFGSKDSGVYLYDGKSYQHFSRKNQLKSNYATHLFENMNGNVWVGSSIYNGKSFRQFSTKDGFPSNNLRLLLEDKTGQLWFCAQQENMFVYDGKTFTVLKNKDGKPFYNVWGATEDRKGNIWFGNGASGDEYGLWRYDGSSYTKVSDRGAYAIIEDKQGNIWTKGALNPPHGPWALTRYDAKTSHDATPTFTEIKSERGMLLGMVEDKKGNIWFGSGTGVYRYDGKTITDFKNKEGQK
jgi:ligand-binding sensor domain-containing protein